MSNYSEIYDWIHSSEGRESIKKGKEKEAFLYTITDEEIEHLKRRRWEKERAFPS